MMGVADIGSHERGWWREPATGMVRPYASAVRVAEDLLGIRHLLNPSPNALLLTEWARGRWQDPVC